MPSFTVALHIEPEAYLRMYQGLAQEVTARSFDGRRVRFPANILKPFLTHQGIDGVFEINFTDQYKFESIKKLSAS